MIMWSRDGLKYSSTAMASAGSIYRSTPHLFVYQANEEDEEEETDPSDSGYSGYAESGATSAGSSAIITPEAIYYETNISSSASDQRKERDAIRRLNSKFGDDGGGGGGNSSVSGSGADHRLTELELMRVETFFRGNQTQIFVGKSLANL